MANLVYWHWLGLSALLFILEVLTGTGFLLCLGLAALVTGIALLLIPTLAVGTQWFLFAILVIVSAVIWKLYLFSSPTYQKNNVLNKRTEQYLGRIFTLERPLVNGLGTLDIDDSVWRIKCAVDLPQGAVVRIIGAEGVILIIEPAV